jgi:predicted CxxxxCH...CXXCH cytochrome family protein
MNGTVNVELYDATAPAGSLKEKNPPTAAYDSGTKTCSNVYCHSGYTVTSDGVGSPLTYPANPAPAGSTRNGPIGSPPNQFYYIMDSSCSNLTYAPYTVNYSRTYKTTPAWGQTFATPRTCTECHGFPPTTYDPALSTAPAASAGAGDSHQWIDNYGYRNLHAWNG